MSEDKKRKHDDAPEYEKNKRQKRIKNPFMQYYSVEEKRYFNKLPDDKKRSISDLEVLLRDYNKEDTPLRFKILDSGIDNSLKAVAMSKLNHLCMLEECGGEYHKILNWIESMCKIPFGKYVNLPVNDKSSKEDIKSFLKSIKFNLDEKIYGHDSAKEHIIRLLAQWISNPEAKGMVIGIQGPMGCGKTTLIKDGICRVLGLPFAFIPLGGANDGCYLEGHSYTYEGATWGKIVDVLMKCKCMNPVLFFDELDKVSDTYKGQEIINNLIHLTDSSQNDAYTDKYFHEFSFDMSRCLIIFSYNHEENVNPILRDRMVRIKTEGYKESDKVIISKKHMIPILLKEYNFQQSQITFTDDVIKKIIEMIEEEQGVRNLRRALSDIISNVNLKRLMDDERFDKYIVTEEDLKKYVHKNKSKDKVSFNMMYL